MENIKTINVDASKVSSGRLIGFLENSRKSSSGLTISGFENVTITKIEDGTTTIETESSIMTIGREGIHFKFKNKASDE